MEAGHIERLFDFGLAKHNKARMGDYARRISKVS